MSTVASHVGTTSVAETSKLPDGVASIGMDMEALDFDDAASDDYWPDGNGLWKEKVEDTTENALMANIVAAEKAAEEQKLTMGASFTQDDLAAVYARLYQDIRDESARLALKGMLEELAKKKIDLTKWVHNAGRHDDLAARASIIKGWIELDDLFLTVHEWKKDGMHFTPAPLSHGRGGAYYTCTEKTAIRFTDQLEKVDICSIPKDDIRCPFCWGDFGDTDQNCQEPVITPCGHLFGRKCLVEVLKGSGSRCPKCRQNMVPVKPQKRKRTKRKSKMAAIWKRIVAWFSG